MPKLGLEYIGKGFDFADNKVDNVQLVEINEKLRSHPVETVGKQLRGYMTDMKQIHTV